MNKKMIILCFYFFITLRIALYPQCGIANALNNQAKQNPTEKKEVDYVFEAIDPLFKETNIKSLITIKNEKDIIKKRGKIIQYIWNGKGFPSSKMPDKIENDIKDDRYNDLMNLKTIDKLTVSMEKGLNSIVYIFHPSKSNNKLILYHQGHDGDFILGKNTIKFFVDKGYSVMAFSLPLLGMNNQPVIDFPGFGKVKLQAHNFLILLKSKDLSPIKFFMEPIAVSLNYAEKKFGFKPIYMIGISGGGWATTLYSAIDTRITKSYPVAGTLPLFLRIPRDWGDWEQFEPELYQIADYLELYILGSYGDFRKQFQILNKYDSCCFAGIKYQVYENEIKKAVSLLGKGEFDIFLDDTHKEHKISDNVLNIVIKDLEGVN
jgi:hypothetical protein